MNVSVLRLPVLGVLILSLVVGCDGGRRRGPFVNTYSPLGLQTAQSLATAPTQTSSQEAYNQRYGYQTGARFAYPYGRTYTGFAVTGLPPVSRVVAVTSTCTWNGACCYATRCCTTSANCCCQKDDDKDDEDDDTPPPPPPPPAPQPPAPPAPQPKGAEEVEEETPELIGIKKFKNGDLVLGELLIPKECYASINYDDLRVVLKTNHEIAANGKQLYYRPDVSKPGVLAHAKAFLDVKDNCKVKYPNELWFEHVNGSVKIGSYVKDEPKLKPDANIKSFNPATGELETVGGARYENKDKDNAMDGEWAGSPGDVTNVTQILHTHTVVENLKIAGQIQFEVGSYNVDDSIAKNSHEHLRATIPDLNKLFESGEIDGLVIEGHCSKLSKNDTAEINDPLSKNRAVAVAKFLTDNGLKVPLKPEGKGFYHPIYPHPDNPKKSDKRNQRVEFETSGKLILSTKTRESVRRSDK